MSDPSSKTPLFFLVAGEASGDVLGARLMQALKEKADGKVRFAGVGGPRMQAEGLELLFPHSELAHMGVFELARHVPNILRRIKETAEAVKAQRPAALVTIDAPDFSFRVAKKLRGQGIPLIHYVAPSVWAWRPGRAKKVAAFLDHLLALLPFEPPYFTKEGLPCTFVGHPLVESMAGAGDAQRFRKKFGIAEKTPVLTVLPGSRVGEVSALASIFGATIERLVRRYPDLHVVIPLAPSVEALVRAQAQKWPVTVLFTQGDEDKYDAFAASRAALACSGTVSVELAMAGLPTIVAYKANPLTAAIFRRVARTKYVTLLNIMQDRMIVPEFLQERCTPELLSEGLKLLMEDERARAAQIAEMQSLAAWLGRGRFVPSQKAAQTVWDVAFPQERRPLLVLQIIPALGTGGAEQACVDIARALVKRGDKALVVSSGGRRVEEVESAGATHILRNVKTKNPILILRNAFWLADLIRREKIALVHARSRAPAWSALIACRLTGARFVTTFHAAYKFKSAIKKLYNSVMARAEKIIAISPYILSHIVGSYGIDGHKVALVERGIDTAAFDAEAVSAARKNALRQIFGIEEGERVILLPARLSPIKGQVFFIEVLQALHDRGLQLPVTLLVGDDQGRKNVSAEIAQAIEKAGLDGKVRMVGACADMPAAYALATLVVAPSLVPEGFGRVPVEAMAMGVPVMAAALGAAQDTVVDGQTGWLVAANDKKAWARVLEKALAQVKEERASMARAGRARAKAYYDQAGMIDKTIEVYESLIGAAHG